MLVYDLSGSMVQTDSLWSIPTVASMLHDGDTNLDEFRGTPSSAYLLVQVGGHDYGYFPLATCVAAIPGVLMLEAMAHTARVLPRLPGPLARWEKQFHAKGALDLGSFNFAERFIASLYTSLAMVLLFLLARTRLGTAGSWFVALTLAFGTSAWSTASRVLWQHGPSLCAVAAVLLVLARPAPWSRGRSVLLGLLSAVAWVLAPVNALTALGAFAFVLLRQRRDALFFVLGALAVVLPFTGFNLGLYGHLLPPCFELGPLAGASSFGVALLGNLVSPARGLFVWTPVFALVAWLGGRRLLRAPREIIDLLAGVVLVAHWGVISLIPHWWAGHSVGPRLFTDVLPWLGWGLIRLVGWLSARKLSDLWVLLVVLVLWGAFAHGNGALSPRVEFWNSGPPDVDQAPARLWSLSHAQLLTGVQKDDEADGGTDGGAPSGLNLRLPGRPLPGQGPTPPQ